MIKNKTILYEQLRETLLDGIKNGRYKAGDSIPSERELEDLYGVSRTTIRKAIDQLVDANYLIRIHGKGTFVNEQKFSRNLHKIDGFTDSMLSVGRKPGTIFIYSKLIDANAKISSNLGIQKNSPIQSIKRIRLLDNQPICLQIAYLPINSGIKVDENDLQSDNFSLYGYLKSRFGIVPKIAFENIEAVLSNIEQSKLLSIKLNSPLLYVEKIVYSQFNKPFEFTASYYRSDRYRYSLRIDSE